MDATTFVDSRVEAWVGKAAIATVVDVDRDPAIAQKYRISAMPTMVALRGDKEIDRVVGALPADAFLDWAKKLESK
jgi:thioredoxin 1